ncbi:GAF and ANTAR domain-containing protein [Streptomyces diacarni]|uniref:GAF and ANTAR domain-containing protein n=1 Tax=Streptomyces diacarni TaxID=2800381 RepID=UPI0033E6C573
MSDHDLGHDVVPNVDLTHLVLETDTFYDFLHALAGQAAHHASASNGCGITLEREHRPLTVVSVGDSASALDEKQYGLDTGPCLQALREGTEIRVDDMLDEKRWGSYPSYAVACGARSSLSLPIAARTHTTGALNLYASAAGAFTHTDLGPLRVLTAQATGAVAIAQRLADAEEFADHLRAALRSRSVIDQAIGVIMGQRKCPADDAFALLRETSQQHNRKLRDLCADLITDIGGRPPTTTDVQRRP